MSDKAHYITTQAKDDPIRYIHREIGYNFRLTNIQAALGVAQLEQLSDFLNRKSEILSQYKAAVDNIAGLTMAGTPDYSDNNYWMNLLQIDSEDYGEEREELMHRLEENNIQTRPVWALNHLQKPYRDCQNYRIERAEELLNNSLCLPSSTNLTSDNLNHVITLLNG